MTIKEVIESLRKEKGCRTLEANICFSKSCEECEYYVDDNKFKEALCVIVSCFDEIDI